MFKYRAQDTLFPSTWIQMQQRSRGLNLIQHDPAMKALCSAIVSFLSSVARLGHLFIVPVLIIQAGWVGEWIPSQYPPRVRSQANLFPLRCKD